MEKHEWHQRCRSRLIDLYEELRDFDDVAPAQAYRLEGFLEAAVAADAMTRDEAKALIAAIYEEVFEEAFKPSLAEETAGDETIRLPLRVSRAPVWPGSSDA